MTLIDLIPIRSNGEDIFASWFNTIRSFLEGTSGTEGISQTSFSTLASQSDTNITGLIFDKTITRKAVIEYTIVTATKVESGTYIFLFDGTIWTAYSNNVEGANSLITIDVNSSSGQGTYSSDSETSVLNFRATTFNI